MVRSCVVFLFQAEDGIRDGHVTGVQTCALPISLSPPVTASTCPPMGASVSSQVLKRDSRRRSPIPPSRSEERRVGKECRSGGLVGHDKGNGELYGDPAVSR